jgi:hypothetical protein
MHLAYIRQRNPKSPPEEQRSDRDAPFPTHSFPRIREASVPLLPLEWYTGNSAPAIGGLCRNPLAGRRGFSRFASTGSAALHPWQSSRAPSGQETRRRFRHAPAADGLLDRASL